MSYCRTLTNAQVQNVLCDEFERYRRFGKQGEVSEAALELYHEAREECARRGIDPNMVLIDRGLRSV